MLSNCRYNTKVILSRCLTRGVFRTCVLVLVSATGLLSGCSEQATGNLALNQADGMVIGPPEFLRSRAIVQQNLTARVSAVADGVTYDAVQTNAVSTPWIGEIYVPEGSSPIVSVTWVETQVTGLPAEYNGELPLAIATLPAGNIVVNESLQITTDRYVTAPLNGSSLMQLDIDSDGAGNLVERQAGSRPADDQDIPPSVLILYSERTPIIDGQFDSVWSLAQFRDRQMAELEIDHVLILQGVADESVSDDFRWAAMHDGTYLYVMVFAEQGVNQTPIGDSGEMVFQDDSVDIYWDGNNSKGASYDGIDDFHVTVGLLADNGEDNTSGLDEARMRVGDRSAPIDPSAIQYAVCACAGDQQIYEFRFELAALNIPVDFTMGFEVNINNDVNGATRDAKWAWFNDTGIDDTWRFPLRMGNVRLEPLPD